MINVRDLQSLLWASHRRLYDATDAMTPEQLTAPSYCTEWSVAKVLSHLGSGAEIFALFLSAGLGGTDSPGREAMALIWERWNAMAPDEQAKASRTADASLLDHVDATTDGDLDGMEMNFFGMPIDAARLLGMRLSEHSVHSWDVRVMADPCAAISPDTVDTILELLPGAAARSGKPGTTSFITEVVTTDPQRRFLLSVSDSVQLAPDGSGASSSTLRLPAEALIRLVYGRLDPEHTPAGISPEGIDLESVRALFPGF